MKKDTPTGRERQGSRLQSEVFGGMCYQFVKPLLQRLNKKLDRRLVKTMLDVMMVIIMH